jgi:hypothetical protein
MRRVEGTRGRLMRLRCFDDGRYLYPQILFGHGAADGAFGLDARHSDWTRTWL